MKKTFFRLTFGAILIVSLSACGSTTRVRALHHSKQVQLVCIERNDKVKVDDFEDVLQEVIREHGLETTVFDNDTPPKACDVVLEYTALRSWDLVPYLSHAELWLKDKDGRMLGHAKYHINGGSWNFTPTKWTGTETKIRPVVEELFENYS